MDSIATAQNILDLMRNPATWIVVIWLGRELFHAFQKRGQDLDRSVKESIIKMSELTIAIIKLEGKLENLERIAMTVPKLQDDLNNLYRKVRTYDSSPTP